MFEVPALKQDQDLVFPERSRKVSQQMPCSLIEDTLTELAFRHKSIIVQYTEAEGAIENTSVVGTSPIQGDSSHKIRA